MKVNSKDLKWYISNIKRQYPDCSEEEFVEHLAKWIETNPGCIDYHGVSNPGRFSYSTVGYGVFSLLGERYRMGRIEVFDSENESGYAVHEGSYCMPFVASNQFEDFINSLETDLPIHFGIGSVDWCRVECAKELGIDAELMNDMETKKQYYKQKNDEYAQSKGYKNFDDLMANSKFGNSLK